MPLIVPVMGYFRHRRRDINKVAYVEPTNGRPVEVVGREAEVSFLLHGLLDKSRSNCNEFTALGIVGTAGSGKTTICKRMFNSKQVQEHFLPRIWVCMTKQPGDDPEPKVAVAKRMLTCLGEDEEIIEKKRQEDILPGLVSLLHRQLAGKRYLIVLDDAWDADKWYNLGFCAKEKNSSLDSDDHRRSDLSRLAKSISDYSIQHKPNEGKSFTRVRSTDWSRSLGLGLPKGYGGAVIVTGRSDEVVERMVGKENLHHLLPLTDEDCWAIFTKASGVDLQLDGQVEEELTDRKKKVEELRRLVVGEAGGHPFMAELMGQSGHPFMAELMGQSYRGNGSSTAPVTGPEPAQGTASQPDKSSNVSSTAQGTGPESAQVAAPQPVNSSNGSSMEELTGPDRAEVIAPQSADSRGVKNNRPFRTKSLGFVKFPFSLDRSKTMGP